jgi:hypothetical protein
MSARAVTLLALVLAVTAVPTAVAAEQVPWSQFIPNQIWRSPDARLVAPRWDPPRGRYRTRLVWLLASEVEHGGAVDPRLRRHDLDAEARAVQALPPAQRIEYLEKTIADLVVLEIHARAAGYDASTRAAGAGQALDEVLTYFRDETLQRLGVPAAIVDAYGQIVGGAEIKEPVPGIAAPPASAPSRWAAMRSVALADVARTRCGCAEPRLPPALADLPARPLPLFGYDPPRRTYRTRLARMLATHEASSAFSRELRRVELEQVELPRVGAMAPPDAARYLAAFALDLEVLEGELLERQAEASNPAVSGFAQAVGFAVDRAAGNLPAAVLATALVMLDERERQKAEIQTLIELGQLRLSTLAALRRLADGGHCPCAPGDEVQPVRTPPAPSLPLGAWAFGRAREEGKPVDRPLCNLELTDQHGAHGRVIRGCHANESFWELTGDALLFKHRDGRTTTRFTRQPDGSWEGPYFVHPDVPLAGVTHYLRKR